MLGEWKLLKETFFTKNNMCQIHIGYIFVWAEHKKTCITVPHTEQFCYWTSALHNFVKTTIEF